MAGAISGFSMGIAGLHQNRTVMANKDRTKRMVSRGAGLTGNVDRMPQVILISAQDRICPSECHLDDSN